MPASYFDVDGTLVSTNLVHPTLFYLMNQATPVRTLQKLGRAFLRSPTLAVAELMDRRLFNEMLFASYEGIDRHASSSTARGRPTPPTRWKSRSRSRWPRRSASGSAMS